MTLAACTAMIMLVGLAGAGAGSTLAAASPKHIAKPSAVILQGDDGSVINATTSKGAGAQTVSGTISWNRSINTALPGYPTCTINSFTATEQGTIQLSNLPVTSAESEYTVPYSASFSYSDDQGPDPNDPNESQSQCVGWDDTSGSWSGSGTVTVVVQAGYNVPYPAVIVQAFDYSELTGTETQLDPRFPACTSPTWTPQIYSAQSGVGPYTYELTNGSFSGSQPMDEADLDAANCNDNVRGYFFDVDPPVTVTVNLNETQGADLSLKVTRNVPVVLNGQVARYTIALQNLGPAPATGVVVTGTLAQYLTMYTRATIGSSQCTTGSTFTCDLATMAVGATVPITFRAVGIGNSQGPAQGDIAVNVSSTSTDPKSKNNLVDQTITANSPAVSASLPSDPTLPDSTNDNSGVTSVPGAPAASPKLLGVPTTGSLVNPAAHNTLPSDCAAGLKSVPIGNGSYNGCSRLFCGADGTGSGDGFGGVRVDAWESGHSGINEFQVTYALWDDQNGWEDSGLPHYTDTSYVVANNSGTNWYVAYHQFDFSDVDTGDAYRVAYEVQWLHKGHVLTSTLASTGWRWDPNATCIAS